MDSFRGSSVRVGTIQRRLARPLRIDDTRKSRSVNNEDGHGLSDTLRPVAICSSFRRDLLFAGLA